MWTKFMDQISHGKWCSVCIPLPMHLLSFPSSISNHDFDSISSSYSWQCNIELTMWKHTVSFVNSYMFESLPLWFVYCHCKSRSNWKFSSLPCKWHLLWIWWSVVKPWDEDNLILGRSSSHFCFDQASHAPCNNQPCTIGKSSSQILSKIMDHPTNCHEPTIMRRQVPAGSLALVQVLKGLD